MKLSDVLEFIVIIIGLAWTHLVIWYCGYFTGKQKEKSKRYEN